MMNIRELFRRSREPEGPSFEPQSEVGKLLMAARELMNDKGRHWIRGAIKAKINGEMCYCSLGALFEARRSAGASNEILNAAQVQLAEIVRPDMINPFSTELIGPRLTITTWNDTRASGWEEVDEKFRAAAMRAG